MPEMPGSNHECQNVCERRNCVLNYLSNTDAAAVQDMDAIGMHADGKVAVVSDAEDDQDENGNLWEKSRKKATHRS